jgi:hypothetical protein
MPIQFMCPHCSATTDLGDEYAGQTYSCAHCGKTVTVRQADDAKPKRKRKSWLTCLVVLLLIPLMVLLLIPLIDVTAMVVSMVLPAVQAAREAGRLMTCTKNLKQIGMAMQGYHQKYGCFPPAFIPDRKGKAKQSWRVLILPFLGAHDLYAKYRFDEPWNGPDNIALAEYMPAVYRCPSDSASHSQTSYAMIVGPHAISDGPTARRMSDVKDRGMKTIMVAEAANARINWLEPVDLNTKDMTFHADIELREPSRERAFDIASPHAVAVNVLFCDGTVHDVNKRSVDQKVLQGMFTIDHASE